MALVRSKMLFLFRYPQKGVTSNWSARNNPSWQMCRECKTSTRGTLSEETGRSNFWRRSAMSSSNTWKSLSYRVVGNPTCCENLNRRKAYICLGSRVQGGVSDSYWLKTHPVSSITPCQERITNLVWTVPVALFFQLNFDLRSHCQPGSKQSVFLFFPTT